MKRKFLYIISTITIAAPWLFLLEVLPIPYAQISTAVEIIAEGVMFAALLAVVILLRKELKRMKAAGADAKMGQADRKGSRIIGRILYVLASLTLFLVGLILVLIAISFSL